MIEEKTTAENAKINREIFLEALRLFIKHSRAHQQFFKADRAQYLINKIVGAVKNDIV